MDYKTIGKQLQIEKDLCHNFLDGGVLSREAGISRFNEEAEKHAYALKGFHTLCGIILSVFMIGIVYSIAYSSLTSGGISQNVENYFKDKNNLDAINKEFSNPEINASFIQTRINEARLVFRNNFLYSCFTFIVINPL